VEINQLNIGVERFGYTQKSTWPVDVDTHKKELLSYEFSKFSVREDVSRTQKLKNGLI
jgi:hypothetical protein